MIRRLDESTVERAALQWLRELGYGYAHGPDISPGGRATERASFTEVVLVGRLRAALEGSIRISRPRLSTTPRGRSSTSTRPMS